MIIFTIPLLTKSINAKKTKKMFTIFLFLETHSVDIVTNVRIITKTYYLLFWRSLVNIVSKNNHKRLNYRKTMI